MLALLAPLAVLARPAYGASTTFDAPVYRGDFPDPAVIQAGGTYWAYATGSAGKNLQVIHSTGLTGWTGLADPLPVLPGWAAPGRTWAPGVVQRGGLFLMYYTVRSQALGIQCISVATSTTPGGTFVDGSKGPLICQVANGGSIDPNPYVDPVSGGLYLLWKSDDNAIGQRTHIWGQKLTDDGRAVVGGSPALWLTASWWAWWQGQLIEGPTIVHDGSRYYLFYGANSYNSTASGIGYATSSSVLGPFTNQSTMGPWLGTQGNAEGPQGPSVVTDASGATRLAWAAWYGPVGYQNGGVRSMWMGMLGFTGGKPSIT
jgi:beta-xylosidase